MYEHLVANPYAKRALLRMDRCARCQDWRYFKFISASGMTGTLPWKPQGLPGPSFATLWWRKKKDGREASAPLDNVCKAHEW